MEVVFKKYPKVFRVGHRETQDLFKEGTVVVEEKMDGANCRWMYDGEKLRFGSRNVELTEGKDLGQFKKFKEWLDDFNPKDFGTYLIYYAEYMIPHTIQYDWDKTPLILGFDIYDLQLDRFLDYDQVKEEFERLGIEMVPVVDIRHVSEIDENYLNEVIPESKYYSGRAEGVVFKNYKTQTFGKLVSEEFKEVNQQVFGKSKKHAQSPEEYILEKYIPPRRVEKVVQALMDEGHELGMELMRFLPKKVWEDLIQEEAANILNEKVTINLPKLKKMMVKRCVNVLQRMIAMRAVNAL
jgi:hypothetical protein